MREESRSKWRLIAVGVVAGVFCGAFAASPGIGQTAESGLERSVRSGELPEDRLVRDVESSLEAHVSFVGRRDDGTGLEYQVEVQNKRTDPTTMRHAIEMVDDLGVPVIEPFVSSDYHVARQAWRQSATTVPTPSSDGYYIVRTHVAAATPTGPAGTARAVAYLEVVDGTAQPVSRKTFYGNSRISKGRKL